MIVNFARRSRCISASPSLGSQVDLRGLTPFRQGDLSQMRGRRAGKPLRYSPPALISPCREGRFEGANDPAVTMVDTNRLGSNNRPLPFGANQKSRQ